MLLLERNSEANAYFELAQAILEVEVGHDHERTLTVGQNLKRAKRCVSEHIPEYQQLWKFAVLNPLPAKKKKKKKKKKAKR